MNEKLNKTKAVYKKITILIIIIMILLPIAGKASILPGGGVDQTAMGLVEAAGTTFFGAIAKFAGLLINKVIQIQNQFIRIEAVKIAWGIFRNFANMFFILLLLLTAFATIFNIQKYKASELLPKIIIAALIINFSYIITILVVDVLYFPAEMFQSAIGNMLSEKMADSLKIATIHDTSILDQLFPAISGIKTVYNVLTGATFNKLIITLFNLIILIIVDFIFLWIAIILLVRIPVLMGLAAISPIAWLAYAFPNIKHVWQKWWQQLVHWGLLPLFYFAVVYFALFFNKELSMVIDSISPNDQKIINWWPLTFNNTILFFVNVGILIGGLKMAHNFAKSSGLWGYNAAGKLTYGFTGGATRLWQRVKSEGVRIPGTEKRVLGAEQKEKREIKAERRLGRIFGQIPTLASQKIRLNQAEKQFDNLDRELMTKKFASVKEKQDYIEQQLKSSRAGTDRHLALLMKASQEGIMDNETFNQAVKSYGKERLVINRLISMMKEKDFASVDPKTIFEKMKTDENLRTNLEARRMFYQFLASKPSKARSAISNVDDYKLAFDVLGGANTAEGKKFESELSKIMPTTIAQAKAAANNTKLSEELGKIVKKLSNEQIAKLSRDEWQKSEFRDALVSKISEIAQAVGPRQAVNTFRNLQGILLRENSAASNELNMVKQQLAGQGINTP